MAIITSYSDDELAALEQRSEDLMTAALQRVMDQIADMILKHARVPVMAAGPPPDVPGQPYVSPDDLSAITPLWNAEVQQMLPLLAEIYQTSGGRIHAGLVEAARLPTLPQASSVAAAQYLQGVQNVYADIGGDLWETARGELVDGFNNGESIDQLATRLRASAGMTARRAELVARSTVIEASNAGSIATARASGLDMQKEWIATEDARTRPTHRIANGQRVDLEATFTVGGFSADAPGDPGLPPAEKYRCRCTIGYVMPERDAAAGRAQAKDQHAQDVLPGTSTGPYEPTPAGRRQAETDEAAKYAALASEADELLANQASARAFSHRLKARTRAEGIDASEADALIQAHGDPERLRGAIDQYAAQHGLIRNTETAGSVERLDRARMDLIGPFQPNGTPVLVVRPGYAKMIQGERVQVFKATVQEADAREAAALLAREAELPPAGAITKSAAELETERRRALRQAARARNREIEAAKPYAALSSDIDEIIENHHGQWSPTLDNQLRQAAFTARWQGVPPEELVNLFDQIGNEQVGPVRAEAFAVGSRHGLVPMHAIGDRVAYDPLTMDPIGEQAYDVGQVVQVARRGQQLNLADGSSITLDKAIVRLPDGAPGGAQRSAMDIIADWDALLKGPGKGKGAAGAMKALEQELASGFEGEFGGLTTRGVRVKIDAGSASVQGEILDAAGNVVGDYSRTFYRATKTRKPRVMHDALHLQPNVQGSGFASEFNQHAYDWYRASGIDRVRLLANIDVGGYTWATQGFDFEDAKEAKNWRDRARRKLAGLGPSSLGTPEEMAAKFGVSVDEAIAQRDAFVALLDRADKGEHITAYQFSQVGRRAGQGGRNSLWFGKYLMLGHGTSWYGVKPL